MAGTMRLQHAAAPKPRPPEHLMHKNRLQEHCQRFGLQLPVYRSVNEGFAHAPKFRASVVVDGEEYESTLTFPQQKDAEQDVAKVALESISRRIKDEAHSFISEDKLFCKSILIEFAVKMNLEAPTYKVTQSRKELPVFYSSLIFNGKCYTGGAGKSKKEAEQLAARTAMISFLGNSHSVTTLSQIIKLKFKLCRAHRNAHDSGFGNGKSVMMPCKRKGIERGAQLQGKKLKDELFTREDNGSNGGQWQTNHYNEGSIFIKEILN